MSAEAFPKTLDAIKVDSRVHFDLKLDAYVLEDANGEEWQFNPVLGEWTASINAQEEADFQEAYGAPESNQSPDKASSKKRKRDIANAKAAKKPKPEKKNTAIYVTNLPTDVDVQEIKDVFGRCGVIAEEMDDNKPRIKLYTNDDGSLKGDALIVFHRPESVNLAIELLDDSDFRLGQSQPGGRMMVQVAESSYKRHKVDQAHGDESSNAPDDNSRPQKKALTRDQQKVIKKNEKMNAKLADWDDEDPQQVYDDPNRAKLVILENAFNLDDMRRDPQEALEIRQDFREEAEKVGIVTNVTIWDLEEDGIVTVRFQEPAAARKFLAATNGRAFDGRYLRSFLGTGREKFLKSKRADIEALEDAERGAERIASLSKDPKVEEQVDDGDDGDDADQQDEQDAFEPPE